MIRIGNDFFFLSFFSFFFSFLLGARQGKAWIDLDLFVVVFFLFCGLVRRRQYIHLGSEEEEEEEQGRN